MPLLSYLGGAYLLAQFLKNLPAMQDTRVLSLIGKIPWGRKWQPTPIFQPGKSHGGGVWQATVHEVTGVRYNLATKPPPPPQLFSTCLHKYPGFPGGSESKQSACNAGEPGSISGLGRSPGEGNGYPPHYSCLENSMTGEPGGPQSMSQRVRHDRATNTVTLFTNIHHRVSHYIMFHNVSCIIIYNMFEVVRIYYFVHTTSFNPHNDCVKQVL